MRRSLGLLFATALGTGAGVASAVPAPASGPAGEIVFASNRATANPGEIYALAPGAARRNLSRSPYADVGLATSPKGRAFAFWSNRSGSWRLMISPDGKALRSLAVARGAGPGDPVVAPVFAAAGTKLLIPYATADSITQRPQYAVASVRSGPVRRLDATCAAVPSLSPDGRLLACAGSGAAGVSVADLHGHVLFTVPGRSALWSAGGRLAVAGAQSTRVVGAAGRSIASIRGVGRAWSRDGKVLVVARPGALVLVRPGRPGAPRVVRIGGNGAPYWLAFTPDGRKLVFGGGLGASRYVPVVGGPVRTFSGEPFGTWSRDGRYAFTTTAGATVKVEVGDPLGRRARIVARLPYDPDGVSALAWLGDGSAVLYDGSAPARTELWAMRPDGSRQHRLTGASAGVEPAWSADGGKLAYSSGASFSDRSIVVARPDGHKLAIVPGGTPAEPAHDGSPSWSPKGTRIAVSDLVAGGVSVLDVASGRRTGVAVDGSSPAWSPDGSTIAFVDAGDGSIWGADPNGANRRRLVAASSHFADSLAWSPDGKSIAFTSHDGVYLAAADGISSPRLVVHASPPRRPSFSPDGRRLVFSAQAATAAHAYRAIFVVGIDGHGLRQLTTGPFDSSDPAWRPA